MSPVIGSPYAKVQRASARLQLSFAAAMVPAWTIEHIRRFQAAYHAEPGLEGRVRHDWTRAEVEALFALPFPDLIFHAQRIHRTHFDPRAVQISTLLSIKTGGCPEDCAYCPQSAQYDTGVNAEKLMDLGTVVAQARAAKAAGATPILHGSGVAFAQGARSRPRLRHGRGRAGLGLETCATLGMLTARAGGAAERSRARLLQPQSRHLAGVLRRDHHDPHLPGPPRYPRPRPRRRHSRVLRRHRRHGRGAGRPRRDDRRTASLPVHPESVPINLLVHVAGTPLAAQPELAGFDPIEFVRTVAVARITMPASVVRLSAGREAMSEETQALCFLAGANSIFFGAKTAHHAEPGGRARCGADGQARTRADAVTVTGRFDRRPPT